MSREEAFLQAMVEDPQAALIFADYLEESGDPRGELLRLVYTLTRAVEVPNRPALEERMRALLAAGVRAVGPFWTNATGLRFAWIPPGVFRMGSPEEELKRSDEEIPHQVTLTKGFWMSVHPVTQAHWRAVRGDNPSNYPGDDRPVERTQWYECQEFCQKLGRTDGRPYRLPTEAEWEYACRAGTTTPFAFGETLSAGQASCNSKRLSGKGKKRVFSGKTTPVGSFPANAWGLHDMHGNVWEWCADWYGPYPNESLTDPQGARKGEKRVIRGGSYGNLPEHCRSAYRGDYAPGLREGYRGLRAAF